MRIAPLLFAFLLVHCGPGETPVKVEPDAGSEVDMAMTAPPDMAEERYVASVTVSPAELFVEKGTTAPLTAALLDQEGDPISAPITWSSSDAAIAEVTETGIVIGRELGQAEVTATSEGVSGVSSVWVTGPPVARIEVSPTDRQMRPGDTVSMTVTAYDALNAPIEDERVTTFVSSDPGVVTVDDEGLVTAVSAGVAQVTTRVEEVEATSQFTVTTEAIQRVELSPVTSELVRGETRQLVATAYTESGAVVGQQFTWSSGNPAIASVDADGLVTGLLEGVADITASAGGFDATATVNVTFDFSAVKAGKAFACGLTGGVAYCWGDNGAGQLGRPGAARVPGPVQTALRFTAIALGDEHACAIATDGVTYCWGGGSATPAAVAGHTFTALFAGASTTCGSEGGQLWCWEGTNAPVASGSYRAVAIGPVHRCAVQGTSGFCWGDNGSGQLGINSAGGSFATPQAVSGGFDFDAIVVGNAHSCGTTPAGASLCWGDNSSGQLGDGTQTQRVTPLLLSGSVALGRLTAGPNHTCGLNGNGGVFCWGANASGQLGNTTTTLSTTPVPAMSAVAFVSVTAGDGFTCALSADGDPYCWGDGSLGQVGTGGSTTLPLPVAGL